MTTRIFEARVKAGVSMKQVARIARKPPMWASQLERGLFRLDPEAEDWLVAAIEAVGRFIDGALPVADEFAGRGVAAPPPARPRGAALLGGAAETVTPNNDHL